MTQSNVNWYSVMESNHRPNPYQEFALPLSYRGIKIGASKGTRTLNTDLEERGVTVTLYLLGTRARIRTQFHDDGLNDNLH